jgi:hypothetical protein
MKKRPQPTGAFGFIRREELGFSLSGQRSDGDLTPARCGLAFPRIGFGLQEEVARRVRHVESDVERGLSQAADLERCLRARYLAAAL